MSYNTVHISCHINGRLWDLDIPAPMSALQMLREVVKLKGTKEGCGSGECGACTIVVNGRAVNSCLMFAAQLDGKQVITVEGLEQDGKLNFIQQSFWDKSGLQCGFCTPGILMSTYALLQENPDPDREAVVKAISGNLCRCTGYQQIVDSILEAAERKKGAEK